MQITGKGFFKQQKMHAIKDVHANYWLRFFKQ